FEYATRPKPDNWRPATPKLEAGSRWLTTLRRPDRGGVAHLGRIRQVHVLAAIAADLHVQLVDVPAARAAALRLVLLDPIEDDRDQAEQRQNRADGEPDEEGTALRLADQRRGEPEGEEDDDRGHRDQLCAFAGAPARR